MAKKVKATSRYISKASLQKKAFNVKLANEAIKRAEKRKRENIQAFYNRIPIAYF